MGAFIDSLSGRHQTNLPAFFTNNSLTRLRELYSSFRATSQTYSIDNQEFSQLFGSKYDDIFELMDSDDNLLIDGLQLFCAMALLSNSLTSREKVGFLFDLFDFNRLRSLSHIDLQFLVSSCCSSLAKAVGSGLSEPQGVQEFIREQFTGDQRISISQLVRWCQYSSKVKVFFELIEQYTLVPVSLLGLKIHLALQHSNKQTHMPIISSAQLKLMHSTSRMFEEQQGNQGYSGSELLVYPEWVYGIRYKDVKQFILWLQEQQKVIYFAGRIVVVLQLKARTQTHYSSHTQPIISLTNQGRLCASGQYAARPLIHVWDYKTKQTISILSGHRAGVSLMKFISGQLLVSCGCAQQSPILIFNVTKAQLVYSTHCNYPAVDLCVLNNFTKKGSKKFMVASLYDLLVFQWQQRFIVSVSNDQPEIKQLTQQQSSNKQQQSPTSRQQYPLFVVSKLVLEDRPGAKITACCFYRINQQLSYLQQYDRQVEERIVVGYQDGTLKVLFNDLNQPTTTQKQDLVQALASLGAQIIGLHVSQLYLCVSTHSSLIHFFQVRLKDRQKLRTVDLTQMVSQLRSYDMQECRIGQRKSLVVSDRGEVALVQFQKQQRPLLGHFSHHNYQSSLVGLVVQMGAVGQHKLVRTDKQELLYWSRDTSILFLDTNSHSLLGEWNVGQQLICFDAQWIRGLGVVVVAATAHTIHSYCNFIENIHKKPIEEGVISILLCVQYNPPLVLVAHHNLIRKYLFNKNTLVENGVAECEGKGPQLSPFADNKILLSCLDNSLMVLLIREMHAQDLLQMGYKSDLNYLKLYHHASMENARVPMGAIVGPNLKCMASSHHNQLHLWNNYQSIRNCTPQVLRAHLSSLADLAMSHNHCRLLTSGRYDAMTVQWALKYHTQTDNAVRPTKLQDQSVQNNVKQLWVRRQKFCRSDNSMLQQLYDQHLGVEGINSETVRRLFRCNLNEWKRQNFQKMQETYASLKLDFVFGCQTFHKNNTVIGLQNPKRMVYFVSKVVVVYDPAANSQQFYRAHKAKITAIVLVNTINSSANMPASNKSNAPLLATGESSFHPRIHIWSADTLQTVRILANGHHWGVIQLAASNDYILSYGFHYNKQELLEQRQSQQQNNIYRYELTSLSTGRQVAYKLQKNYIYAMALQPSDPLAFATCSEGRVTFWKAYFGSIQKRRVVLLNEDTPTCCLFYCPGRGQADLLVGTRSGSIGVVSRRAKYTMLFKGGKQAKQINCLALVELGQPLLAVASQDNLFRLFDLNFQQRYRQNMAKIEMLQQQGNKCREIKIDKTDHDCSIQSMCLMRGQCLQILAGTRNGEIMCLVGVRDNRKTITFRAVLYLKFNISQGLAETNKTLVALSPKQEIMVTVGWDQQLIFWDYQRKRLLYTFDLGQDRKARYPTAMKFTVNGQYLIVGFSDGIFIYLQAKISKSIPGKLDDKFSQPNLGKIRYGNGSGNGNNNGNGNGNEKGYVNEKGYGNEKANENQNGNQKGNDKKKSDQGHAVVGLQISENNEYLAVSFHKLTPNNSSSYIKIYVNKFKERNKNSNKPDTDNIFEFYGRIPCPHSQTSFTTERLFYGYAAYSMAFAESEGKQYFLIYYQLIDQHQNRIAIEDKDEEERYYKIWDVASSTDIANVALIESICWKKLYFHSSLTTKYLFHRKQLTASPSLESAPSNNNLLLPQLSDMCLFGSYLAAASFNGDLHLVGLGTLEGGQGMVGKTVTGHSCRIHQLEVSHNRGSLFSSGVGDQCVFKWNIDESHSPARSHQHDKQSRDLFAQVSLQEQLSAQLSFYRQKSKIARPQGLNSSFLPCFRVANIMGRSADQNRNNMKIAHDKIVYASGCAVVLQSGRNRQFLYLRQSSFQDLQEVTGLLTADSGRLLLVSMAGSRAGVVVWRVDSKQLLKKLYFVQLVRILYMAVSYDCQRMVVYGLNAQSVGQLCMVDLQNQQLLAAATYTHKQAWFIKGISFVPHSHQTFMTCGVQHTKIWQYMSGQLVYNNFTSNDPSRINTCIGFVEDTLLTANDYGQVMLWTNNSQAKVYRQHSLVVNCMDIQGHTVVTGGLGQDKGPQVVVWKYEARMLQVQHKITVQSLLSFPPLVTSKSVATTAQSHPEIQSVSAKNGAVLIGTTRGDVYQYGKKGDQSHKEDSKGIQGNKGTFGNKSKQGNKNAFKVNQIKQDANEVMQLVAVLDNDPQRAMFFTPQGEQLVTISHNGYLQVLSVPALGLRWAWNFNTPTIGMVHSSPQQLTVIAFKDQVRAFLWVDEQKRDCLTELQEISMQFYYVTHLMMSSNQKMIALGIQRNSDHVNLIQLYDISNKTFKFQLRFERDTPVLFIDFNTDTSTQAFIMIKTAQELEVFDLWNQTPYHQANTVGWTNQGQLHSSRTQTLRNNHQEGFGGQIGFIVEVREGFIVLQLRGGIYWYKESCFEGGCMMNMSSMDTYALSGCQQWLAVSSGVDRNLVLLQLQKVQTQE